LPVFSTVSGNLRAFAYSRKFPITLDEQSIGRPPTACPLFIFTPRFCSDCSCFFRPFPEDHICGDTTWASPPSIVFLNVTSLGLVPAPRWCPYIGQVRNYCVHSHLFFRTFPQAPLELSAGVAPPQCIFK